MRRTVCVAVAEPTTREAVERCRAIGEGEPLAAAIEVRLDALRDPDPAALVAARPDGVRLVLTCRAQDHAPKDEGARLELLRRALAAGADLVDVEREHVGAFRRLVAERGPADAKGRLVVSEHDFVATPGDAALAARLDALGALARAGDVVKLATMAADATDSLRLLAAGRAFARRSGRETVVAAMGEGGLASRILAPLHGLAFTFAAASADRPTAPGQPAAAALRTLYRHGSLGAGTQVYGLVGRPVGHSLSPAIHNAALAAMGLDAVYVPFDVGDAERFFAAAAAHGVRGLSVTAPHKLAALAVAGERAPSAEAAGAANTLALGEDGRWRAANTDADAAADSLEAAAGKAAGRRVAVLGAGGAARAVARALAARGAAVAIHARDAARGEAAARDAGCRFAGAIEALAKGDADVIVNATPVGSGASAGSSPIAADRHAAGGLAFDLIYAPERTRFLEDAAARGAGTLGGLDMLLRQAAAQLRIWTGREAPLDVMRRAAEAALAGRRQ